MTFTTPPDGSIVFTAAALAEHDRQEREKALAPLRAAVVDALDNADDSDIGWDAEMSATSLLELIDEQASNVVETEPPNQDNECRASKRDGEGYPWRCAAPYEGQTHEHRWVADR